MEGTSAKPRSLARKIAGRFRHFENRKDKIVPIRKFGDVARVLWPEKTATHIAAIGGADERTGKRWLRGEAEPPPSVLIACLQEMLRVQE